MQKISAEAKVLKDEMSLESPLLPLGIVVSPVAAGFMLFVSILANIFLLPLVVMYQLFAFFFPNTSSRILNITLVYYEGILIFLLRVRETVRTFIMTNLQKETFYNGKKLDPFFADLIAMSPNAHEYIHPKLLGEEFVKTFGQYMPEGVVDSIKAKNMKINSQ